MEKKHRVVFTGRLLAGKDPDDIYREIAGIFKVDAARVKATFRRGATVVSAPDIASAERYVAAFKRAGALCEVVPPEDAAPLGRAIPKPPAANADEVPPPPPAAPTRPSPSSQAPSRNAPNRETPGFRRPAPSGGENPVGIQSGKRPGPPSEKKKFSKAALIIFVAFWVVNAVLVLTYYWPKKDGGPGWPSISPALEALKPGPDRPSTGKQWEYPPEGGAEVMAKTMSVAELRERWLNFPEEESKYSIHSEFAKALGLKGEEAAPAVPDLARFATDENLYLRQGALAGLAGIGEKGLPHLIKALQYKGEGDAVTIRWDAAIAMSKMGPKAAGAVDALRQAIMDDAENVNVKADTAAALAGIGDPAAAALVACREYFYAKDGLSVSENGVLRQVNIAYNALSPAAISATESAKAGGGAEGAGAGESEEELIKKLRDGDMFGMKEVVDKLVALGKKDRAVDELTLLLRDKDHFKSDRAKGYLKELGVSVPYAYKENSFLDREDDECDTVDWQTELRGDKIYTSGTLWVGRDVAYGQSRPQTGNVTAPTFIKLKFTVKGGTLAAPVIKEVEIKANSPGEYPWDEMLASGAGQGEYTVDLFIHVQYTKPDGHPYTLNDNSFPLELVRK